MKTGKLPISVKTSFAIADFGKNCLIIFNTYYLLYFYTDVIKMDPGIAAVIMAIARIWDAINDPMMGIIVDRTKSKEGKCRFYLKYFSVPAGVCLFLSYYVPELSSNGKIFWVAITYIFQGMATTITSVPLKRPACKAHGRQGRACVSRSVQGGRYNRCEYAHPGYIAAAYHPSGGVSMQKGFAIIAAIYGVFYALCHLIAWWGTRGYEKNYDQEVEEAHGKEEKVSVGQMLKALMRNKFLLVVCVSYIGYLLYGSLMGSTLVFYLQYNIGNTDLMSIYSVLGTITSIIPIFMMGVLSRKLGNAKTCFFGCILAAANYAVRFFTKDAYLPLLYVCWGIEGIGLGLFGNLIFQSVLDSMTYGKWKTGVDNQAVIMSVFTFSQKFGQAIGGVIAAWLLDLVPYEAGMATQDASVLNLFFSENITIPGVVFIVISVLFLYIAHIEKKIPQMQREIEQRELLSGAAEAEGVRE